jgi:hypothetical protein
MAVNIKNLGLTLLNNYYFNSFCRFNGKHLGADSTHIYDLDTGTTDNGTNIVWNIRTPYLDLQIKEKKRLHYAWLSYKSNGDLTVTVHHPDGTYYEALLDGIYTTETGMRVKFGKGDDTKYTALDIKNVSGSTIIMDVIRLHMFKVGGFR